MSKFFFIITIIGALILGGVGFWFLRNQREEALPVLSDLREEKQEEKIINPLVPVVAPVSEPLVSSVPNPPPKIIQPAPLPQPLSYSIPKPLSSPAPQPQFSPEPIPATASPEPLPVLHEPAEFIIKIYSNTKVDPVDLTIRVGDTVTFVNEDRDLHWPGADPHPTHSSLPAFDALGGISQGQTYSYTFRKSGAYGYHEHLLDNPPTWGVITVLP